MGKAIILAAALALAGCATSTPDWCAGRAPIRPTEQEIAALSGETLRQILEHNRAGERLCGWRQ